MIENALLDDYRELEKLREKEGEQIISFESYLEKFNREERNERLKNLLLYTRELYYFCYYCGAVYDSSDQLDRMCPGIFEEDH